MGRWLGWLDSIYLCSASYSIPLVGKQGCCIPMDQCCEHYVRGMKNLLKSLHSHLEPALVEKAVLAHNPMLIMQDHLMECLGNSSLQSGGGHRHNYLSSEEKKTVRVEVRRLGMFDNDFTRDKVKFHGKAIRRVWEGLNDKKVQTFLSRNCERYHGKRR